MPRQTLCSGLNALPPIGPPSPAAAGDLAGPAARAAAAAAAARPEARAAAAATRPEAPATAAAVRREEEAATGRPARQQGPVATARPARQEAPAATARPPLAGPSRPVARLQGMREQPRRQALRRHREARPQQAEPAPQPERAQARRAAAAVPRARRFRAGIRDLAVASPGRTAKLPIGARSWRSAQSWLKGSGAWSAATIRHRDRSCRCDCPLTDGVSEDFPTRFCSGVPPHRCSDSSISAAEKTTCTHTAPANFRLLTPLLAESAGRHWRQELVLLCSCWAQVDVALAVPAPPQETRARVETAAWLAQQLQAKAALLFLAAPQAWQVQVGPAQCPQPAARPRGQTDPAQQQVKLRLAAAKPRAAAQARLVPRVLPLAHAAGQPAMRRQAQPAQWPAPPPQAAKPVRAAAPDRAVQSAEQQHPVQEARLVRAAVRRRAGPAHLGARKAQAACKAPAAC